MGCSPRAASRIAVALLLGFAGGAAFAQAQAGRPVRVARAEAAGDSETYPSSLYVENDVKLAARISGIVERVLVDRGRRVKKGQELAVMETDVISREVDKAVDNLRLAEAEYARLKALYDSRVASIQDYQRAEIARDVAKSEAELQKANLERCYIRAPFDGVVVERWAVPGKRVYVDDNTPLFRVVGDEPLRARIDVPERRARSLPAGGPATLVADGREPIPAKIVFLGPVAEPASGTVPVIVEASSRRTDVKPGGSVTVRFDGKAEGDARIKIPRTALPAGSDRDGADAVVLAVENGRAAARRVRVVSVRGDAAWVEGDLKADERVIVSPGDLASGAAVEARGEGS